MCSGDADNIAPFCRVQSIAAQDYGRGLLYLRTCWVWGAASSALLNTSTAVVLWGNGESLFPGAFWMEIKLSSHKFSGWSCPAWCPPSSAMHYGKVMEITSTCNLISWIVIYRAQPGSGGASLSPGMSVVLQNAWLLSVTQAHCFKHALMLLIKTTPFVAKGQEQHCEAKVENYIVLITQSCWRSGRLHFIKTDLCLHEEV